MACCFACILQSGGGSGLSAQIGALQQSWRANAPADFARTYLRVGAVAVRYAHLAATAMNMRTGGGKLAFVGASECRGPSLYGLRHTYNALHAPMAAWAGIECARVRGLSVNVNKRPMR